MVRDGYFMEGKAIPEKIVFDLDKSEIMISFKSSKLPLTLRFESPSRKFYFSVITFLAIEMKKASQKYLKF